MSPQLDHNAADRPGADLLMQDVWADGGSAWRN